MNQDVVPAPKRRTATAKPSYKEESSVSEESRPKKQTTQALGERSDVTNVPASKAGKPVKEPSINKKLPSTIVEESEDETPPPKVGKLSTAKPSVVPEDENSGSKVAGGEKKKKRKLGALLGGTTFTWDQNLVS